MLTIKGILAGLAFGTGCFALGAVTSAVVREPEPREPLANAGKPVEAPTPAPESDPSPPPVAPAEPVTDSLHFDLACEGEGRVIWQDDPTRPILSPNPQRWDDDPHLIVDLESMRYCEPHRCRSHGPQPIEAASPFSIIFSDRSGYSVTFRYRDRRYAAAMLSLGRIQVTEARCTVEPFSGFPPIDPAAASAVR